MEGNHVFQSHLASRSQSSKRHPDVQNPETKSVLWEVHNKLVEHIRRADTCLGSVGATFSTLGAVAVVVVVGRKFSVKYGAYLKHDGDRERRSR